MDVLAFAGALLPDCGIRDRIGGQNAGGRRAGLSETNLTGAILLGATMPDGIKQDRFMEPAAQPA